MLIRFRKTLRQLFSSVPADCSVKRRRLRLPLMQGVPVEQLEKREVLTVTMTYEFVDVQNIELTQGPTTSQPATTALANGGFAVSGTGGGNTDVDIFNSNLSDGGGANNLTGTNSAIAQLQTGDLVIVSQDSDSVRYAMLSPTGTTVLNSTDTNDLETSNPDVAASGSGFWIVYQDRIAPQNSDIKFRFHNNNGTLGGGTTIDNSSALDARPSVAVMGNGQVVVAWTRTIGFHTQVWRAIYNSNGSVFAAPALVDSTGTTNRNVDVVSTVNGFAMVYEDSEWSGGNRDITLKRFNSSGTLLGTTNLSDPDAEDLSHESSPTITRLANGVLVAGWNDDRFSNLGTDTDTFVYLVDPNTGNRLSPNYQNVIGSAGNYVGFDVEGVTIAGSSNGRINVFHRNNTNADVDGESIAVRRTSTSNADSDTIIGDFFIDVMNGNAGNDTLRGGDNNDQLNGGPGTDSLNGERGTDTLTGGLNADTFVFTLPSHSVPGLGRDQITDFSRSQGDRINVAAIDGMMSTPGLNGFTLTSGNGSGPFTAEGQIRVTTEGNDAILQFNQIGSSTAEMEITLAGFFVTHTQVQLSDFIFGGNMPMRAAQIPQSSVLEVGTRRILPSLRTGTDTPVTVAEDRSVLRREFAVRGSESATSNKSTSPAKRGTAVSAPVGRQSAMSNPAGATTTLAPLYLDEVFATDDLTLN
jgi:Ca2+-binding RTX toxin-like protein